MLQALPALANPFPPWTTAAICSRLPTTTATSRRDPRLDCLLLLPAAHCRSVLAGAPRVGRPHAPYMHLLLRLRLRLPLHPRGPTASRPLTATSDGFAGRNLNLPPYAEFLALIRRPDARPILKSLKSFASSARPSPDLHVRFRQFVEQITAEARRRGLLAPPSPARAVNNRVRGSVPPPDETPSLDSDADYALWFSSSVERWLMMRLAPLVEESFTPDEITYDLDLRARVRSLATFVDGDRLGVPRSCRNGMVLELACEHLRAMDREIVPADKLECVVKACNVIFKVLRMSAASAALRRDGQTDGTGADEFLPSFLLAALRADVPRLWMNTEIIRRYSDGDVLAYSQAGYCFTNLRCAVSFFETANAASLSMGVEDFQRAMSEAARRVT